MKIRTSMVGLLAVFGLAAMTPAWAAEAAADSKGAVPKAAQDTAIAGHAMAPADAGFKSIFDGKTLTGWDGDPSLWRVEDGIIVGQTTADKPIKYNTFLIWRQGEVDDFELTFDYRITGGNSGVQYRSWELPENPGKWGKWVMAGNQADIDAKNKFTGILYSERARGVLAERGQRVIVGDDHKPKVIEQFGNSDELRKAIHDSDWNSYRVVGQGPHLIQEINGQKMVDVMDEDATGGRRSGLIAFQLHVGEPMKFEIRNVLLKRLPMESRKKIVFVAGPATHGYGEHEHPAGCLLLAKLLNESVPEVFATVYRGWPTDPTAFDNANAVVVFSDGGEGNLIVDKHLDEIDALAKRGLGLAFLHYALELPKGRSGDRMLEWIGGYYEPSWSVNPRWTANFTKMADHPITRGVKPFEITDEWYYHMRFTDKFAKSVTTILEAIPPDSTRGPDGTHSGNPTVRARKGMPEVVAWAFERPSGGRGFGWTGGHFQWNFAHESYRKLMLNALVWIAGAEVPKQGVVSKMPTLQDLLENLEKPRPADFDMAAIERQLAQWAAMTQPAK